MDKFEVRRELYNQELQFNTVTKIKGEAILKSERDKLNQATSAQLEQILLLYQIEGQSFYKEIVKELQAIGTDTSDIDELVKGLSMSLGDKCKVILFLQSYITGEDFNDKIREYFRAYTQTARGVNAVENVFNSIVDAVNNYVAQEKILPSILASIPDYVVFDLQRKYINDLRKMLNDNKK